MHLKGLYVTESEVIVTYIHRTVTFDVHFDYKASFRGFSVEVTELGNICKALFISPNNDTFSRIVAEHPYIHDIFLYKNGVTKHFSKNI